QSSLRTSRHVLWTFPMREHSANEKPTKEVATSVFLRHFYRMEKKPSRKGLKRLDDSFYQGENWVHWNMTINHRAAGWLSDSLHLQLREAMLHTLVRYQLTCPVYCLMPDHGHLLWG
ncbi:MAG: hypothetical protein P1U89_02110, partial [Verrucomicrobiales bacterium]|nr:hypothetical protein [Verrucomicrobiales bacterium]